MTRLQLPTAAINWLAGDEAATLLLVNPARAIVSALLRAGHQVIAVDDDPARGEQLVASFGSHPRFAVMSGRPDALPVQPCIAKVLLLSSAFRDQQVDTQRAYAQFSRALQPGGWVSGWQITRDDSVPWVRRLIRLMRELDPEAMPAQTANQHADLLASKYFPRTEQHDYRLWVPMTRDALLDLVSTQQAVVNLAEAEQREIRTQARQIFDNAANYGELRLPYQLKCWRAHVDHHELTTPITFTDQALIIPI